MSPSSLRPRRGRAAILLNRDRLECSLAAERIHEEELGMVARRFSRFFGIAFGVIAICIGGYLALAR